MPINDIEKRRASQRAYAAAVRADPEKLETLRASQREWARQWREKNKAFNIEVQKRHRQKMRLQVLAAYGDQCACCGMTGAPFLAIDHVDNDGAAHRKAHRITSGTDMMEWLKRNGYPPGFQILCHNCNVAKHHNGGVCPHATSSASESSEI